MVTSYHIADQMDGWQGEWGHGLRPLKSATGRGPASQFFWTLQLTSRPSGLELGNLVW